MRKNLLIGVILGVYMFIIMSVSVIAFTPDSTEGKAKLGITVLERIRDGAYP